LNKRGQGFSTDLLIAMGIFLIVLVASLTAYSQIIRTSDERAEHAYLQKITQGASQILFTTAGGPSNWETLSTANFIRENVQYLGLTTGTRGQIQSDKLQAFVDQNASRYEVIRAILGLDGFDYYFKGYRYDGVLNGFEVTPSYVSGKRSTQATTVEIAQGIFLENGTKDWLHLVLEVYS
jgi:hypothetical protein